MQKFFASILASILLVAPAQLRAANPSPDDKDQTDYRPVVDKLVKGLDSTDPIDVKAAEINIMKLPPETLPLLQAAAAKPGLRPYASSELKRLVAKRSASHDAQLRTALSRAESWKWNLETALSAYDRAGSKNPKWDADARKAIEMFVTPVNLIPRSASRKQLEKAIESGCDDPLILYFEARSLTAATLADQETVCQVYDRAAAGFEKLKYSASRKVRCYAWSFTAKMALAHTKNPGQRIIGEAAVPLDHLVDETKKEIPFILDEKMPRNELLDCTSTVLTAFQRDRKDIFDAFDGPAEKAMPGDPTLLTVKGRFYIDYAWDARGGGVASTVTPEGMRDMKARLDIAADALTKAWEKDPTNEDAAAAMMKVELGQGQGRERMETWFKRGIAANPDSRAMYAAKLYYLQPKWHGSPQDMINFGHESMASEQWYGDVPLVIVEAYRDLSAYAKDQRQFYAVPQVWSDLNAVYAPYVRARPDDVVLRNAYCYFACLCGKWEIARKQFELLGNRADPGQFGGPEKLEAFRKQAGLAASSPATP